MAASLVKDASGIVLNMVIWGFKVPATLWYGLCRRIMEIIHVGISRDEQGVITGYSDMVCGFVFLMIYLLVIFLAQLPWELYLNFIV